MYRFLFVLIPVVLLSCGGEANTDDWAVNSKYSEGKEVYKNSCIACHMEDGKGLEGVFPPLADSDYLLADPVRALKQVLEGSDAIMTVNGVEYDEVMPPQDLSNEEAVDVVNYILNAWGNDGGEVTIDDLEKIK